MSFFWWIIRIYFGACHRETTLFLTGFLRSIGLAKPAKTVATLPPDEAERKKVVAAADEAAIARIKKDTVPEIRQLQSLLNEKALEAVSANYSFLPRNSGITTPLTSV